MEIAPRVGSDDLEPLALRESGGGSLHQEREHALPVVLYSPLTSRIRVERASVILIASNKPGFPDLTELLEAPPCQYPAGSICYPRWRARCGTRTWNYGAIMCDRFRGIRGDGRLTVSHAHGSAKTLYKTFVCFKMGVFVKESGSYRPDYLHRIVCSEFPAAQTG